MPIIKEENTVLPTDFTQLPAQQDDPEHSFMDALGAAFEQENTVGSAFSALGSPNIPDAWNNTYNPYNEEDMTDFNNAEQVYLSKATNKIGYEFYKKQLDNEKRNRKILAESGGSGIAAIVAAGIADPVNFIPVAGWAYKFGQGSRIIKSTLSLAAAGAVTSSVSEVVLHSNQALRTAEDSAIIIGGSTILSGVLGAGIGYLSKGRAAELSQSIDNSIANAEHRSVGAAANENMGFAPEAGTTLEQEQLLSALGLERMNLSPMMRAANSPELLTRQFAERLVEMPYYKQKHLEGIASQVPVSARIDDWNGVLAESQIKLEEQFRKFSTRMRDEGGQTLSRDEFYVAAGRAARSGDTHMIPEIEAAAKAYREKVFDPMLHRLQENDLLPEGLNLTTAPSYLTRVYNRDAIKANRTQFQSIIEQHLIRTNPETVDISDAYIIAEQVVEHILGSPLGKLKLGEDVMTLAGSLKERTLNIPDELIDDFIYHDIGAISERYIRSVAPELEMKRAGFSRNLEAELREVNEAYTDKISAAGSDMKQIKSLENQRNQDIKDLRQFRDEMFGTFGRSTDPDSIWSQSFRTAKKLNYVTMLGQMTVSATGDMANPIIQHGLRRYSSAMYKMATNVKAVKLAKNDMRKMSVGLDMVQSGRARALANLDGIDDKLDGLSGKFSKITLMDHWNSFHKQFSGIMNMDALIDNSVKMVDGSLKQGLIKKMARSGVDSDMATRIGEQFRKFGQEEGGLKIANIGNWDDEYAALVFRTAVRKNVDWTINTPKDGILPTWMRSEAGGVIGQFKSFIFIAHQQTLIPALQAHDRAALSGGLMAVGLGSLAMTMKHMLAGRELPQDVGSFMVESIDAAGPMAVMMEMNNMSDKISDHKFSLQSLFGGNEAQRYSSRSKTGAMLGPTFGQVDNMFSVSGDVLSGDINRNTIGKIRKFVPLQNVFYLRNTFDAVEESFGDALGLDGNRKPFTQFKKNLE